MNIKRSILIAIVGITLLGSLFLAPLSVAARPETSQATTTINTSIYLTAEALKPYFQERINQQVPQSVNGVIDSLVKKQPQQQQGWMKAMAGALLQPGATLTDLTTQQDGLVTSLRLSLYQGDPKPTDAQLLVTLSVLDQQTIQVSAKPLAHSPALFQGPLTTLHVPLGQLQQITTTPSCGQSALGLDLGLPLSFKENKPENSPQSTTLASLQPLAMTQQAGLSGTVIEIPETSLASIGKGIGALSLGNNLYARNIQISVQNGQLVSVSDITLGQSLKLGVATTLIQPDAAQGKLAMKVQKTTLKVLSLFDFEVDAYNQQIEQQINMQLNTALANTFTVTEATIGSNASVPCTANTSLLLTGTLRAL
ncbi:hypothetical protein EI42_04597 [Thermosporothrix hazakensis]|jgi:hypothetical protein|uniref:Uncharacterized protein n=1 Tax=Thermosporothrix hazakensis TaxID=644383 RepID=A0A326UAI1_THEHA|nr:hypothetical protein [Thermosporothrix hazakensis]PZW24715.1 hypothetical protein EI42_04597 [Thermosporothrix hazakensis]GCE48339.1 hypothetical protein KTH_32080 [Thermosporothrix hazakensis]